MEYIEIGQIVNTNGLKGVVKVNPFTDDISKFEDLKYVYIQLKNELKKVKIEQVRYNKNEYLGKIEDVFPTGSNDVYVVKDNLGKQILIPAIADVVKEVDLKNKKMTINLIPGLI